MIIDVVNLKFFIAYKINDLKVKINRKMNNLEILMNTCKSFILFNS